MMNKFTRLIFTGICFILMHSNGYCLTIDLSIAEKTKNFEQYSGYFNYYWDENEGKIWLEIESWEKEFLYVTYLAEGIGSNDIGLDRGQIGRNMIVKFERYGPKVLLIQPNYNFRADSDNPAEQQAVRESFARSVIWGFTVSATDGDKVLVDATDFFLRDAHHVITVLKKRKQGDYQLDRSRSTIYMNQTKNFPMNTEVESMLTFSGESPGNDVQLVVPSPEIITINQHHSFVKLPEEKFEPRAFDPRAGYFPLSYFDYSAPIDQPVDRRYIFRHRLQKKNPQAAVSEAVAPIVYYVDNGTPEPIRTALMEGAEWWNEAFEASGYRNAFEVRILPEDADPLDIRYNVIQWVHRSSRGWSYGSVVSDPRTGEILKGHVSLGSLRVRQDFLIAQGLLAPYSGDTSQVKQAKGMALARIRQLSAHEVGHTLGLAHNFAASSNQRASVMDYPQPLVRLTPEGNIDLSEAYEAGIGSWDKVAIAYGYQDFPEKLDESAELNNIINKYIQEGLLFISDDDARPAGSAHPLAHLWDNGPDPINELSRIMHIRKTVLEKFSGDQIPDGTPVAKLEEVLVPIYMFHRYQAEAVVKLIGGQFYTYALKGDGQQITEIMPPEVQRKALDVLLKTISPENLAFPEEILKLLPPRPIGYPRTRELFTGKTGVTFDPLTAAESAANLIVPLILNPQRAARLVEFHSRDPLNPEYEEMLERLIEFNWKRSVNNPYHREIQRVVANLVLTYMMKIITDPNVSQQVRALTYHQTENLKKWLKKALEKVPDEDQRAYYSWTLYCIERFLENPEKFNIPEPADAPDGPPIGMHF